MDPMPKIPCRQLISRTYPSYIVNLIVCTCIILLLLYFKSLSKIQAKKGPIPNFKMYSNEHIMKRINNSEAWLFGFFIVYSSYRCIYSDVPRCQFKTRIKIRWKVISTSEIRSWLVQSSSLCYHLCVLSLPAKNITWYVYAREWLYICVLYIPRESPNLSCTTYCNCSVK